MGTGTPFTYFFMALNYISAPGEKKMGERRARPYFFRSQEPGVRDRIRIFIF